MELVFATNNNHKLEELKFLLPKGIQLLSLKNINCDYDIPETADTLEGNAALKADYVTKKFGYPCFADDTGLFVEALNGAPGVHSARYAGPQKKTTDNIQKLLSELGDNKNRSAYFKTAIALNLKGKTTFFEGHVWGTILHKEKGRKGFGYDPVFVPTGYEQSFAELTVSVKNSISHRARAFTKLIAFLDQLESNIFL